MNRLSEIASVGVYRIDQIEEAGEQSLRLKRLGFCAGRPIEVVHPGDPMIVQVAGSRVGVSRRLAENVLLEPVIQQSAGSEISGPIGRPASAVSS